MSTTKTDLKKKKAKDASRMLHKRKKAQHRTQFAALCYRVVQDKVQILLVTSRTRGRWIIPKGWPMEGKTPADAALQEAFEEGGVIGKVSQTPLGVFGFDKQFHDSSLEIPVMAVIYPVKVKKLKSDYPELRQRKRKWMSIKKAANKVEDKQLRKFLKQLNPRELI